MLFCATDERAVNEVFNVTNGDFFRWQHVWPQIAGDFGLPFGDVQAIALTDFMADKEPVWQRIVDRYELRPTSYREVAAWPFADYGFGCD
jgi:hypothetical protein